MSEIRKLEEILVSLTQLKIFLETFLGVLFKNVDFAWFTTQNIWKYFLGVRFEWQTRQSSCSTHLSYPRISLREDPLPPFAAFAIAHDLIFPTPQNIHFKLSFKIISSDFPALLISQIFVSHFFFSLLHWGENQFRNESLFEVHHSVWKLL